MDIPSEMRAMILAAGRGERMRPLTDTLPKPLLKVGGKPLIEWHIQRLAKAGFTQVVINHAWLGAQIENRLGDGRRLGVTITYSPEETPLETAGGIARALPFLGSEPFLILNGDVWCDWDPAHAERIAHTMQTQSLKAWLLLAENPTHHPDGDFGLDNDNLLCEPDAAGSYTYTGIGVFHPALFADVDANTPSRLAPLLYQAMARRQIAGQLYNGLWTDVGTPQRLAELDHRLMTLSAV